MSCIKKKKEVGVLKLKTPSLCAGIRSSVSLAHHTCVFHSALIAAYCTASLLMAPIRTFHSTTGGGGLGGMK